MVLDSRSVSLVAPLIGEAEIRAVERVMRSGQLAQGPEVAAFEREFASVAGVAHAVAVNSGTAAIHAALEALGIGDGDEVLTTPFTFAATATPILMQRALPRFVDIDARTFNLDVAAALGAASSATKGFIGVDLFGLPFDTAGIGALSARGIPVVEDACQAIGAARDGVAAGARGAAAAFSLYATKNLMTGEGGMLTTNDAAIAAAARRFRQHGMSERYEYISLGYNYRMTDLLAAIGRVQLGRLETIAAGRSSNAAFYDRELAGVAGIVTPFVPAGVRHAYHQYSILIDGEATKNGADRNAVRAALSRDGVASGIYYPTTLPSNRLFAAYGHGPGDFPVAERVARQVLALPIHPQLTSEDLTYAVQRLRAAVGETE
jgi:dTDP-4-amino-4,6-dideoxygalactose transaminase